MKKSLFIILSFTLFIISGCSASTSSSSTASESTTVSVSVDSTLYGNKYRVDSATTYTFISNEDYILYLDSSTNSHPLYLSSYSDRTTALQSGNYIISFSSPGTYPWTPSESIIGTIYAHCSSHADMGSDVSLTVQ